MCGNSGSSPSIRGRSASPEGRRATFGSSRLAAKKGKGMSQHGPAHGESHSRLQVNFRSSVSKPDPIILRMRPGPSDEPTDMKQHHAASRHPTDRTPAKHVPIVPGPTVPMPEPGQLEPMYTDAIWAPRQENQHKEHNVFSPLPTQRVGRSPRGRRTGHHCPDEAVRDSTDGPTARLRTTPSPPLPSTKPTQRLSAKPIGS